MKRTIAVLLLTIFVAAGCAPAVPKGGVKAALQPPSDAPPAANAMFVIHAWSWKASTEEGRQILQKLSSGKAGAQSRDLGDDILTAAFDGKVKPAAGCHTFRYEFHDIAPGVRQAPIAWVSGAENQTRTVVLGQDDRIFVCNGQGRLIAAVSPVWATKKMALTVRAPFQPPKIRYPLSGALKTCGPATAGACGGEVKSPTDLYNRVSRRGVSHFHFVVE